MRSPYQRRPRRTFAWWQLLLMSLIVALLVLTWDRLGLSRSSPAFAPPITPTMPQSLTQADVLPTPTPDPGAPRRALVFPGALARAPIIEAVRSGGTWEVRHLGDAVGHLQGTAWLDDPGGNIVLAGHVETAFGTPGPFAHLFEVQIGDEVILYEDERAAHYRVVAVEEASAQDIHYAIQDGQPRLTLITCDNWDQNAATYLNRLVVVAEPVAAE